ncbi:MAG: glycerol-3-phosphate dehydrogenase C-terminal domain-containing protein [Dongiaceae bacterium]
MELLRRAASLYDDGASAAQATARPSYRGSRCGGGQPALLSVFGGKITTCAGWPSMRWKCATLSWHIRGAERWTGRRSLPGGEFPVDQVAAQVDQLMKRYPFLARPHAARLVRMYGTRAKDVLGAAQSAADLGRDLGATLTEAEVGYLMREEWAESAADVLWRRSKLGLRLSAEQAAALEAAMAAQRRNAPPQQAAAGGVS